MSLRRREYLNELTTSSAIPGVVRPFAQVNRRVFPRTISGVVDRLKRLSDRLKHKPAKKRRKRDKDSLLRGLM